MKDLQWQFELFDKMSGQADRITLALDKMDKALGGTKKNTDSLQNSFGGFSGPVGTVVGGLKWLTSTAIDAGFAVASIGAGFARAAVDAIGFKESTLVSFKAMTGSWDQANDIFARSMKFADLTPFGSKDVVQQMKMIMGAGFKQERAEDIFAALSDVAAVSGGGAPAMQGMLAQMAQAKAVGKFQMQDLKAIMTHAGPAGVSLSDLYDNLAASTGRDRGGISADLSAGNIDAEQGIQALLEVIQTKVSKGKLGQASLDQGTTIAGLISTIESFPEKLFYGIDLNGTGIKAFKGFLVNVIDAFNKVTATGGKLQVFMNKLTDSTGGLFEALAGPNGAERLERIFNTVIDGVDYFFDAFGDGLGEAGKILKQMVEGRGGVDGFAESMRMLGRVAGDVAVNLTKILGLLLDMAKAYDMIAHGNGVEVLFRQNLPGGNFLMDKDLKDKAAMHEKLRKLGYTLSTDTMSVEPMSVEPPMPVSTPGPTSSVPRSFSPGLSSSTATAVTGGPKTINVGEGAVKIVVEGGGQDTEGLARKLSELLPGQLNKLFESLATEMGEN